jgi:hypothetical protein
MTEKDLRNEWAWSQVEAYADGSLQGPSVERMQAAVRDDPRLADSVERARALHRALRADGAVPMPAALRLRLLGLPSPGAPRRWVAAPAALALAALAVTAVWLTRETEPPPPDPRIVAIQEFEIAMKYVRKSAAVTSQGVAGTVSTGMRDALVASRNSIRSADQRLETGG